jgi:hypothetical protein
MVATTLLIAGRNKESKILVMQSIAAYFAYTLCTVVLWRQASPKVYHTFYNTTITEFIRPLLALESLSVFNLFGFYGQLSFLSFSFWLDPKRNKKVKANAKLRRFAVPRLPMCCRAHFYFLSSCVMVYNRWFMFALL